MRKNFLLNFLQLQNIAPPSTKAQNPAQAGYLCLLWTHGESHPGLVHAMDACYCYTMGPIIFYATIFIFACLLFETGPRKKCLALLAAGLLYFAIPVVFYTERASQMQRPSARQICFVVAYSLSPTL